MVGVIWKYLSSRSIRQSLPNIPILVIAVETEGSHDKLLEEGRSLTEQWGAMFISTGQEDWDGERRLHHNPP